MGKKSRSIRHIAKMAFKRQAKAKRAALYETMASSGDNTKRKRGDAVGKVHIKIRDPACHNIGDILYNRPHVLRGIAALGPSYTGRYKALRRLARLAFGT